MRYDQKLLAELVSAKPRYQSSEERRWEAFVAEQKKFRDETCKILRDMNQNLLGLEVQVRNLSEVILQGQRPKL